MSTTENTQAVNKLVENSATSILNVSFVLSITGNLRPFLYALRVHCHTWDQFNVARMQLYNYSQLGTRY